MILSFWNFVGSLVKAGVAEVDKQGIESHEDVGQITVFLLFPINFQTPPPPRPSNFH